MSQKASVSDVFYPGGYYYFQNMISSKLLIIAIIDRGI